MKHTETSEFLKVKISQIDVPIFFTITPVNPPWHLWGMLSPLWRPLLWWDLCTDDRVSGQTQHFSGRSPE